MGEFVSDLRHKAWGVFQHDWTFYAGMKKYLLGFVLGFERATDKEERYCCIKDR